MEVWDILGQGTSVSGLGAFSAGVLSLGKDPIFLVGSLGTSVDKWGMKDKEVGMSGMEMGLSIPDKLRARAAFLLGAVP